MLFLLLCLVGSVEGARAFTASITDQTSWDEAMSKLKTTTDSWIVFNFDADVSLTGDINFDKNSMSNVAQVIVLDLNGHKVNAKRITVDESARTFATLHLKDGQYKGVTVASDGLSVENTNSGCLTLAECIEIKGGAKFLLENGVLDGENSKNPVVCVTGDDTGTSSINSQAYINNGYIKGREGCVAAYGKGATIYVDGTKQMIGNDGQSYGVTDGSPVLTCLDNAPVAGNGTRNATKNYGGTAMTIGKSVLIGNIKTAGYVACGIYHPQNGQLTIKDGAQIYANGGVGVLMRGGKLTMTGGEIVASGDKELVGKVGDSRVVVPTSGIVFDDYAGYYDHANVNVAVSGGTVTGSHSAVDVVKGAASVAPEKQVQLSGGTYSSDIAEYAAEGMGSTKSDGAYTLAAEEAQVEYADGTVGHYAALQDALNIATDGSVVKLAANVDKNSYIVGRDDTNKSITLDLNGKSLQVSGQGGGRFYVYCGLTVTDSQGNGNISSYSTGTSDYSNLFYPRTSDARLTLDGGKYSAAYLVYYDNSSLNPQVELKNGYFDCDALLLNAPVAPNIKIYAGYFKTAFANIRTYLADGYEMQESKVSGYAVRTRMKPVMLTYGETQQELEVDGKSVVIDLKDDAAASERLSKIEVQVEKPNADITLQKNFAQANVWNAFYVPFDITATAELLEQFDVAKIWDTELYWNDGTPETTIELIKLNEGDQIAAFTPCLIRAKAAGKQDVTFRNVTLYNTNATKSIDCSTVEQKFTFSGVLENTLLNGNYALNTNGELVQSTNDAAKVSPFKFYMTIENKAGSAVQKAMAYRMRVIGEDVTGITEVNAAHEKQNTATVYNLQGVAVGNTMVGLPAGVYVQNGRKVMVK